jgi:hypothetical protein
MKLSDILELKSMGYSEEIDPKHLKQMKETPSMLKDFEWKQFAGQPPYGNDNSKTKMELHQLAKLPMDKSFVEEMDDVSKVFKEYCDTVDIDFPKGLVDTLLDDSRIFITRLKYLYNRPRPKQLAKHPMVNVPMKDNELDSMKTPSYPSGHSTQGVLIGLVLSDMYPDHQHNLMDLAKDISYSRNVARAHYPSDSRFGEKLGNEMFKYLKKMERV